MSTGKNGDGRNITVGNINRSQGVAIGDGAFASVNQSPSDERAQVSELLDAFIESLPGHSEALNAAGDIWKTAVAARAEVNSRTPKWPVVRRMLTTIASGVVGVAALTDAISNIQALVANLSG